jgi:hypothetical protein
MSEMLADRINGQQTVRPEISAFLAGHRWPTIAIILLSGLFIYLQLFVPPCTPRLASGDQAIYLHHGTRMLEGEVIYRDYDHFTFPGTDVLYMFLFKLFGVRAWIPQAMLVVLGTSMVWLILLVSKQLMSGTAAYLPPLLFVTLPFSSYLDATHHWYSLVAVTAAIAILLKQPNIPRLAWAGVLLGIATFFTQSMALLAVGVGLFLLWDRAQQGQIPFVLLKKELSLLTGFLGSISACMAYFVWKVGAKRILFYTVVFVVKYYPADWFNNWRVYLTGRPRLHDWTSWLDAPAFALLHLIVPFIYIFFLVVYGARSREHHSERLHYRLMLLNVLGLFLFVTVASAPAYSRLYVVSPPALVLLIWLLDSSPAVSRAWLRLAWLIVFVMLIARPLATQLRSRAILDLPIGRTAFFDPLLYEKCKWTAQRTQPGDYFFGDHLLCFNLRLRNAGRVPFLRPTDYTRPEEVSDAIRGISRFQVRFVSWYIGLDREKLAMRHPDGNHLGPIRLYLNEHYHIGKTFANGDEIWERNQ